MSASAPLQANERNLGRLVRRALLWSLAFLLLLLTMMQLVDVDALGTAADQLGIGLIALVLGLAFLNYFFRACRWHYSCAKLGVPVPFPINITFYVGAFAFGITPGKIGEAVRLWFMKRRYGYGYDRTASLMIIDRLTDAWPVLLLSLLGAAEFAGQGWMLVALTLLLVVGSVVMLHPGWLRFGIKTAYARVRRGKRLFARLLRAARTLGFFANPMLITPLMLLGLAGWSCEMIATWLILDALGSPMPLTTAAFVFGFSMLVGAIPIFPGGVGGAEGTMIGLLLFLGVPLGTAVAATAIVRLATLGLSVVVGFLTLPAAEYLSRPRTPALAGAV